jgi:DNA-binding NtrC family response regulator
VADILVVANDRDLGDLLAIALGQRGHTARAVAGGGDALLELGRYVPDAVLIDEQAATVRGGGLQPWLLAYREVVPRSAPPFVLLGECDDPDALDRLGPASVLSKPVSVDLLASALREAVGAAPRLRALDTSAPR